MKHKILKGILMMGIWCLSCSAVHANPINLKYDGINHSYSNPAIKLFIDGQAAITPVPPVQISGNVLVPAREVFSVTGAQVEWRSSEQSVYVHNDKHLIVLKINSNEAWVDGETKLLAMPAKLINDKVMIPIRFISEALGYSVNWSSEDYAVYVVTSGDVIGSNQNIDASDVFNGVGMDTPTDFGTGTTSNAANMDDLANMVDFNQLDPNYLNNYINQGSSGGSSSSDLGGVGNLGTVTDGFIINGGDLLDNWIESPYVEYFTLEEALALKNIQGLTSSQITYEENVHEKQMIIHLNEDYSKYLSDGVWTKDMGTIQQMQISNQSGNTDIILTTSTIQALMIGEKDGMVVLQVVMPSAKYDKIVVIDAGHGYQDSGASYGGIKEKDLNLAMARSLINLLEMDSSIKVYATRTDDTFLELNERTDFANQIDPDLYISIHVNSYTNAAVQGTETYYTERADTRNKVFAQMVQNALVNEFGTKSRGVKSANYYVTKYTEKPAILTEIGFLTNESDRAILMSSGFESRYARAVYQCILDYFNQGLNLQ